MKCTDLNRDALGIGILQFTGEESVQYILQELSRLHHFEASEPPVIHHYPVFIEGQLKTLASLGTDEEKEIV